MATVMAEAPPRESDPAPAQIEGGGSTTQTNSDARERALRKMMAEKDARQLTGDAASVRNFATQRASALPDYGANDPERPDILPPLEFDPSKTGAQIRELMAAAGVGQGMGGEGGGTTGGGGAGAGASGAGSGSGSGSSGGGGKKSGAAGKIDSAVQAINDLAAETVAGGEERNADVREAAEAALLDALNNAEVLKLDPKYAEQAEELRQKLEASRGQLVALSPEDQQKFAEIAEAEQALLNEQFKQGQDALVTQLFGSGREQSTFAMEQGGLLLGQQGLVMQQQAAAANARELSMRQFLTQEGRENLMGQAAILESERAGELQNLGLQAQQVQQQADRAAGVFSGIEDRATQRELGALSATTQAQTAKIGATASMENARVQAAATRAAAAAQAAATRAAAASAASASRFAAMKRLEGLKYSTTAQTALQLRGQDIQQQQFGQSLAQQQYETDLGATVRREGMQTDYGIADLTSARQLEGAKYGATQAAKSNRRSSLFGAIGAGLGMLGAFSMASDENVKDDILIADVPADLIDKLVPKTFRYKEEFAGPMADGEHLGFVAQDVEKVLPTAVRGDGVKMIDYAALVAVLVHTVQDLRTRVEDLEMEVA